MPVSAAGLHTRGKWEWIGQRYFINSPGGQGNSNVRAVEAMEKVLTEAGWDILKYQYRIVGSGL